MQDGSQRERQSPGRLPSEGVINETHGIGSASENTGVRRTVHRAWLAGRISTVMCAKAEALTRNMFGRHGQKGQEGGANKSCKLHEESGKNWHTG